MKLKVILLSWFSVFFVSLNLSAQESYWNPIRESSIPDNGNRQIVPLKSQHFTLDLIKAKKILDSAPMRFSSEAADKEVIFEFPTPDGKIKKFRILEAPVFAPELAAKYPGIQSFAGQGIDDPHASVRFDIGPKGFHAMILSPNHSSIFIDPYHDNTLEHYSVYYKKDFHAHNKFMTCDYESVNGNLLKEEPSDLDKLAINGDCQFRTYRMALACTGEYANFHGGTVPLVLAAMNTSMTRVNGIYEREMSVTMVLVPNNDLLIFLNSGSDPYTNNNGSAMLSQNISTCNSIIGSANYDIGHVFSTGGGGVAYLQSVCGSNKAGGVTGQNNPVGDPFDVDYVCHEVGHQFGGRHTQNNSCNRDSNSCYEPGSASTIMGYAGICSPNVQSNSDDYFHINSLIIMNNFITGSGNCSVNTNTGNNPPLAAAGPDHVIPKSTPFVLEGSATDSDNDPLTYCWEQYDKQVANMPPQSTNTGGPAFRSLDPSTSPDRYMPTLNNVVNNTNNTWEVLPSVTRTLRFRLTARDNHINGGCTHDDLMNVDVTASSGPFLVLSPNTNVSWPGNSSQTVSWDVANTNNSPVNCSGVDIFLSYDGGFTYPVTLATNVSNDGSETVTLPGTQSTSARIMVKGHNNIFYDISNQDFTISAPTGGFILGASPTTQTICGGSVGNYSIITSPVGGFNNPVSLSISGLPGALNANFSPNPVIPGSNSSLTISNTNAVPAGTYNFIVTGTSGAFSFDLGLTLLIESGVLAPGIPSIPANGATGLDLQPALNWQAITGADTYEIQVSDSPTFSTIIESQSGITGTSYDLVTILNPFSLYYWRVRGSNNCVTGSYGAVFNFTTGNTICSNIISTDIPISISNGGPNTVTSDIVANNTGTIADVNIIGLDISHTYIEDLEISISAPSGTSVSLVDQICGSQNNMFIGFDDESPNNYNSIPCPPLDGSSYQPNGDLSDFIGENGNGTWELTVADLANQDGGSLNAWSIDICFEQLVPLAASIQGTDVDCFGGSNGTAFVIPTGGTGAYTYQWSTGGNSSAVTNLTAGNYTCTISDGNSSITLSVQIDQASSISVNANVDPVSNGNDGAIDLSVNGGTQPYNYSWSNGATSQDISGLDQGIYTVTITDGNDCISIEAYEILLPPAPVVVISADVVEGCSPLSVQFTDLSSNNPTAWTWTFEGGTPASSTAQNPIVSFNTPGLYTVSLTAENPGGAGNSTLIDFIEVLPNAVPSFSSTVNGLNVSFNNQSTNADSYSWDFGDGQGSTAINPNHTYQSSGQYTVILTVTNDCGQFTTSQNIDIIVAPAANFEVVPSQGCEPLTVQFISTSIGQVDNYLWIFEGGTPSTSTEANPIVIFTEAGLFDVSLQVSNNAGADQIILSDIIEVFPLASANYSFTENGLDVNFTNLSQNATSYAWDFGDGQASSATNPSHTYQNSGTYNVVLTASNNCGSITFSQEVSVLIAPSADFDFNPAQGCSPLTVQFNSTSTGTITNYSWTFEGGTPANSSEANPVVIFNNAGLFDISLSVSNAAGADEIVLQDVIEVFANPVPEFDQTIDGLEVNFTNLSQNASSYSWNFGDGNTSTEENPIHTYLESGTYTVILIASNACGDVTFSEEISILVPPIANFSFDPDQGCLPLTVQFSSNAIGTVDNYLWTFEGATPASSTEANPLVVFENAGVFGISLNVSNAAGADELILQDVIEVLPIPQPSFDFISNGLDVVFTNQSQNATSYSWNFGDGNGSSEENPEHSYEESGNYTVILTASNECGDFTFSQEVDVLIAPVADFDYGPAQGCAALTVQFNSTSLGLVGEYLWTFEGGSPSTSTEANPVVVFNTGGTFDVSLEVSNAAGADLLELNDIIEVFTLPTPQFESSQNDLEVQFTNLTINAIDYEWDFGDGNTSNEINPSHIYADGGSYSVSLTASNDCGSFTITQLISVLQAPSAGFGSEQNSGCAPFTVQFTDQSLGQVDTYLWTFEGGNPANSTEANPIVVYQNAGNFTVSLVVTNAQGENELIQEDYISVATLPTSNFSYSINGNSVDFSNETNNANDFIWDFGDGNLSNEMDPMHTYLSAGIYTVSLTAFNDCGQISVVEEIIVGLEFPTAAFEANALIYCAPSTVSFTDLSTGNPDTWLWTFEGGTPETSTQQNPTVIFADPGTYDISLEVSNSLGSNTILAENFMEIATVPTVGFTIEIIGGNTFQFNNTTQNAAEYLWDFGDGNTSTASSPSHVYSETGNYTVSLTAINDCGESILIEEVIISSSSNPGGYSNDILLIPNPNQGRFTVDWTNNPLLDVRKITVINTLGQLMFSTNEKIDKNISIDLNYASAGVYYLIMETPEQQIIRKVVIQ